MTGDGGALAASRTTEVGFAVEGKMSGDCRSGDAGMMSSACSVGGSGGIVSFSGGGGGCGKYKGWEAYDKMSGLRGWVRLERAYIFESNTITIQPRSNILLQAIKQCLL